MSTLQAKAVAILDSEWPQRKEADNQEGDAMAAIPTPPPHTEELLTSPFMKKMNTPTLQEDVNVAVIGGTFGSSSGIDVPQSNSSVTMGTVIAVVFVTLLSVVVLIIIYLYKNKGSYRTYERPEAESEGAVQMEDLPCKGEKEEYFI
ncbi:hypothetical protein lerEdw1_004075 [Lerista edwardsae]|nr:hypothetical protein lerEdw1_004075 [Lerista edwardsae]